MSQTQIIWLIFVLNYFEMWGFENQPIKYVTKDVKFQPINQFKYVILMS